MEVQPLLVRSLSYESGLKSVDMDVVVEQLSRIKECGRVSLHTNCLCDALGYIQWKLVSITEFFVAAIVFALQRFFCNTERKNEEMKTNLENSILAPNAASYLKTEHLVLIRLAEFLNSIGKQHQLQFSSTTWNRSKRCMQVR